MSNVVMYTANVCQYCSMVKRLLARKQVTYTELNIDESTELREAMMQRTKRRTVPKIYIDDFHVGGFDELHALEKAKKLDALLTGPGCR